MTFRFCTTKVKTDRDKAHGPVFTPPPSAVLLMAFGWDRDPFVALLSLPIGQPTCQSEPRPYIHTVAMDTR